MPTMARLMGGTVRSPWSVTGWRGRTRHLRMIAWLRRRPERSGALERRGHRVRSQVAARTGEALQDVTPVRRARAQDRFRERRPVRRVGEILRLPAQPAPQPRTLAVQPLATVELRC